MIVSIAAAALAVQLSMTPGSAVAPVLPQAALPKPCNTVSPFIRRHAAMVGI
jgi:hypothetical protein